MYEESRSRLEAARQRVTDPRVISAVLVVVGVGLTALAVKTPWSPLPRGIIAISGLAGSVVLWWHRRRPAVATVTGAVVHVLSGNPWPLLVGLFSSAATRRFRLLPALVVGTIGFAALNWLEGDPVKLNEVVSAAVQTAVSLAIGVYVGTRQQLVESLRDQAERAEAERHRRVEQAKASERTRIAREMHDGLAHKMSLIALHAGAVEANSAYPPKVGDAATLIGSTAREALEELRWVLGLLRTDGTDSTGGEAPGAADGAAAGDDLFALVTSWKRAGVEIQLHDELGQMPAAIGRAAYRLVQEGLTNAHKHAPGSAVVVSMTGGGGDDVVVSVVNDGADSGGSPGLPGAGTGLVGLGERLHLVGGTLVSGQHGAGGWKLEGRFPWPDDGARISSDGSGS